MDEMFSSRLFGGPFAGLFGAFDLVAMLAFVAFATVYVAAPALGYRADRRGLVGASLYILIGYGCLSVLQMGMLFVLTMDRPSSRSGETMAVIFFGFTVLKMMAFLLATLLFVIGIQMLRLRRINAPDDRGGGDYRKESRYEEH
jgi:hypothetical protein